MVSTWFTPDLLEAVSVCAAPDDTFAGSSAAAAPATVAGVDKVFYVRATDRQLEFVVLLEVPEHVRVAYATLLEAAGASR